MILFVTLFRAFHHHAAVAVPIIPGENPNLFGMETVAGRGRQKFQLFSYLNSLSSNFKFKDKKDKKDKKS